MYVVMYDRFHKQLAKNKRKKWKLTDYIQQYFYRIYIKREGLIYFLKLY